ncbi:MAG: PEP-CTERM sorting domain-containing protein [Tepidisphaeraceae bacterium]
MRKNSIRLAACAATMVLTTALAHAEDVVFQDTFGYASSADLTNPAIGGWTSFNGTPGVPTTYALVASGSGYINGSFLPPAQPGQTMMSLNNRGAWHDLGETLTGDWKISVSMLINAYSRSATIGLMDSTGSNGYGFVFDSTNPNNFGGKGLVTLRKIPSWATATFVSQQGTALGGTAGSSEYPTGFALPSGGPFNTTDGIPYAPDAPFLGFASFEVTRTAGGTLTISQGGVPLRSVSDSAFNSFSRLYLGGGSTTYIDNITVSKNINIVSAAWNVDSDGNWSTGANWTGGAAPNAAGAIASFGTVITAARTVTVDAPQTVGAIDLSSATKYTIAGTSAITLDATTGPAQIIVGTGTHVISAPIVLSDDVSISTPGGTGLTLSSFDGTGHGVTKNGGGTTSFNTIRATTLNVAFGMARVSERATSNEADGTAKVDTLVITANGKLDLTNNSMVLDYTGASPATAVRSLIASAYAGGAWNGATGIGSLSAFNASTNVAIVNKTAIGFAEASDLGVTSFGGQSFTGDAILLKYTVYGDWNLDGNVNFGDLLMLAANYGSTTGRWSQGDGNYDGNVNFNDLLALASNYGYTPAGALAASVTGSFAGDWALAQSMVPEPSSAALVLLGMLGASRRRRG